jgi:uncharacterized protein
MSAFNPEPIVTRLFRRVRKQFELGMQEYLTALDAIKKDGWCDDPEGLRRVLQLLWCHSLADQGDFALAWDSEMAMAKDPIAPKSGSSSDVSKEKFPRREESLPLPEPETAIAPPHSSPHFAPLPVRPLPVLEEEASDLQLHFPATRRSMTYTWRYLRRLVADGPVTVLDIEATVEQAARQGFYLAPVYRRSEVNHAQLILLVDQDGSMMPFHRFTRDLVETAQDQDSSLIETLDVYYFHNVPTGEVYQDPHCTKPVPLSQVLADCDSGTSVLIVSDAGAGRGYRRMERVRATTDFLMQIKQRTALVSWLNPMPVQRWESTSAEIIAFLVRMQPMDDVGLSQAIDVVRGQAVSHVHNDG